MVKNLCPNESGLRLASFVSLGKLLSQNLSFLIYKTKIE